MPGRAEQRARVARRAHAAGRDVGVGVEAARRHGGARREPQRVGGRRPEHAGDGERVGRLREPQRRPAAGQLVLRGRDAVHDRPAGQRRDDVPRGVDRRRRLGPQRRLLLAPAQQLGQRVVVRQRVVREPRGPRERRALRLGPRVHGEQRRGRERPPRGVEQDRRRPERGDPDRGDLSHARRPHRVPPGRERRPHPVVGILLGPPRPVLRSVGARPAPSSRPSASSTAARAPLTPTSSPSTAVTARPAP